MIQRRGYGFDLGSSNMYICQKEKGLILNEPEVIAMNKESNDPIASGFDAYDMFERTPNTIEIQMPIQHGVIAEFESMKKLLEIQCKKLRIARGIGLYALVASPYGITEVEKRALNDLFMNSYIKFNHVQLMDRPVAALIGCGVDVLLPQGNLLVDIGGGTTEISVLSLGGIVRSDLLKIGGQKFDLNIKNYIKRKYNVTIGLKTAEKIKMILSSFLEDSDEPFEVTGRDILTGLPKMVFITAAEIYEGIREEINTIVEAIKAILEKTPPELSADIIETGIHISGGSSLIKAISECIRKETFLEVHLHEFPEKCVINGLYTVLNQHNKFEKTLYSLKI